MKLKKINIFRYEAEITFDKRRPVLSRLLFLKIAPHCFKVFRANIGIDLCGGAGWTWKAIFVCIPKFKFKKGS